MPRDIEPRFYVDECLGSDHFIDPLRDAGLNVVRHREILKKGVPDETWIGAAARAEYFALTEDANVMRKAHQSELIIKSGLGLFIVKGSKHSEKGKLVVQNRAQLLRFIKKNYRPFIATITQSGVHGRRPIDRQWGQKYQKTKYGFPIKFFGDDLHIQEDVV